MSAERGHLGVAQELLEHKAYVNAKSKVRVKLLLTDLFFIRGIFGAPKETKYGQESMKVPSYSLGMVYCVLLIRGP